MRTSTLIIAHMLIAEHSITEFRIGVTDTKVKLTSHGTHFSCTTSSGCH